MRALILALLLGGCASGIDCPDGALAVNHVGGWGETCFWPAPPKVPANYPVEMQAGPIGTEDLRAFEPNGSN